MYHDVLSKNEKAFSLKKKEKKSQTLILKAILIFKAETRRGVCMSRGSDFGTTLERGGMSASLKFFFNLFSQN